MASLLQPLHSHHWLLGPFYFTINASLPDWSIFSWLGPQSIYSHGHVLVICRVSREACGFVTVARDVLVSRCPSHPIGLPDAVFSNDAYIDLKGGGNKKGKNARENNISFAQRPVSRMITLLTQFYFLKLYNVHSRPTKANSPTRSSSRQRGWKTEFANQFFSGSSSSLLCRGRIVFKNNFHMRPDSMIAAGVVKSWMSSLLLTECS